MCVHDFLMHVCSCSRQSRLLNYGIELLEVGSATMNAESGIELPHSRNVSAVNRNVVGQGGGEPRRIYHKLIIAKFSKFTGIDNDTRHFKKCEFARPVA